MSSESAGDCSRDFRVLIVDDEDSVVRFLDRVLTAAGYQTAVAATADAALRVAATTPFTVLITDHAMADNTGDYLARRLRNQHPNLKVVYLVDPSVLPRSTREYKAFINKPVSEDTVREAVSLALFGHTRGPGVP